MAGANRLPDILTRSRDTLLPEWMRQQLAATSARRDLLKEDPATQAIPVVIVTSRDLTDGERATLGELGAAVVSERSVSRESALAMIADAVGEGV